MKNLILVLLLSPFFISAQSQGVSFAQSLNWQQILDKAKAENKFIFVDCYASWCGPCKAMDKYVYPNDTTGSFMNDNYISVKIQMDSVGKDDKETRKWYAMSHEFESKYSVTAYPSFLFFSAEGIIVDKEVGARDVSEFIEAARRARAGRSKFYDLVSKYEEGKLSYDDMPSLADSAWGLGLDEMTNHIIRDYFDHYLLSMPEDSIWTQKNLSLVFKYRGMITSRDKIFQLYFANRKKIDSVATISGYSSGLIEYIIYKEYITPVIKECLADHAEPKWHLIAKSIKHKFAKEYVQTCILKGRVDYYKANQEWQKYVKYMVLRYEKMGIRNFTGNAGVGMSINNHAFEVFQYSRKKKELRTALLWINRAFELERTPDAEALDTKANLLYKLGRRGEGLALEKQAVDLKPKDKEIEENFNKMQKGLPTWLM